MQSVAGVQGHPVGVARLHVQHQVAVRPGRQLTLIDVDRAPLDVADQDVAGAGEELTVHEAHRGA
ncbi:MAG TPA: hypothetical protein VHN80_28880, partial [Kineosporiaceae bacterium]|nr:hypothetical protein [Kineosporiaceae bacterium]